MCLEMAELSAAEKQASVIKAIAGIMAFTAVEARSLTIWGNSCLI